MKNFLLKQKHPHKKIIKLEFESQQISTSSYYQDKIPKDCIFIHHTNGYFRPDWVINSWNKNRNFTNNKIRSCSAFVIGGLEPLLKPSEIFNGKIYKAFEPENWAHHLFIKSRSNTFLNQKSISIQLCNYGALSLSNDGRFYTDTHIQIPENQVIEIPVAFRGNKYFHKYSDSQIESLRILLVYLSKEFCIDLEKGLKAKIKKQEIKTPHFKSISETQCWLIKNSFTDLEGKRIQETGLLDEKTKQAISKVGQSAFEISKECLRGDGGVWSHTNIRKDKIGIFPQKEIMQMVISL